MAGTVDAELMEISLVRVIEAARRRQAALTPEVAGYIVLLAAQQVATLRVRVDAGGVLLVEGGDVLVRARAPASEREGDAGLRALLATLIALSVSPPPAIRAVAERAATGELHRLVAELSAALIPINHAAARRALARLYRETRRASDHAPDATIPAFVDPAVDAQTNELDIDVVVDADGMTSERPPPDRPSDPPTDAALPPAPDPASPALAEASLPPRTTASDPPAHELSLGEPPPSDRPPPDGAARFVEARSDVRQLLDAFLAETCSVRDMVRSLREMIGLELRPSASDEPGIESDPLATSALSAGAAKGWPA